jgi:cytochrome d ubiquinol oxidase subunit I
MIMSPAGLVAILAGWLTTEIGRQPWVVYNVMRTADGVTPLHSAQQVGFTLGLFVVVYLAVFGAGTGYGLRLIAKGPEASDGDMPVQGGPGEPKQPMRPLSAAPDDLSEANASPT